MVDFLLVADAGQGPRVWDRVWGHLTAPVEHPPQLRTPVPVNRVLSVSLEADSGSPTKRHRTLSLAEAADQLAREVDSKGLKDLVAVGHGAGGTVVLAAVPKMTTEVKGIVLLAGIVPRVGESIVATLPLKIGAPLGVASLAHRMARRNLRLPRPLIYPLLFNGMDSMESFSYVSNFYPLPLALLGDRLSLGGSARDPRTTYVVLERDRLVPPNLQREMARRLTGAEVATLATCHQVMIERPKELAEILSLYT